MAGRSIVESPSFIAPNGRLTVGSNTLARIQHLQGLILPKRTNSQEDSNSSEDPSITGSNNPMRMFTHEVTRHQSLIDAQMRVTTPPPYTVLFAAAPEQADTAYSYLNYGGARQPFDAKTLKRLHDQGLTTTQIAGEMGFSASHITNKLNQLNLKPNKPKRGADRYADILTKEVLRDLVRQGNRVMDIVSQYGHTTCLEISENDVRRLLTRYGISIKEERRKARLTR